MPSERSKPSEMTGEKAARSKVRSISLATCCSPFWTTTGVTESIGRPSAAVLSHALWLMGRSLSERARKDAGLHGPPAPLHAAHGDLEIAECVHPSLIARLDQGGGVQLLHDRRPRQGG